MLGWPSAECRAIHGFVTGPSDKSKTEESRAPDAPPTSRLGRLARLGALAPRALPLATIAVKRALVGPPSEEEERKQRAAAMASAKKTAEAMLKTLGEMKGLPLKLGQMASYIDGLAPPGYEERFQQVLSKLQSKAPPLSATAARTVVEEELGGKPEDLFATWEAEPFAAASIGQVHRARTRAGDVVAVKVQYPGIDRAIENDLKSLSTLESMISPIGRRYGTKEGLAEVASVFLAELDYGHEAEMADTFRRIHEDDLLIVVPEVHHSLTTRRVLTSELIGGEDYASFAARASQAERNAAGETIWRFMFRALFVHGLLYADPHPGNYRFLGGGRVAMLDYGCTKKLAPHLVAGIKRYIRAAQDENWPEFERACVEVLGYDPTDAEGWALYTTYTKLILSPLIARGPFRFTRAFAREAVAYLARNGRKLVFKPGDSLPNLPKPISMPTDFTFVNRLQWGLSSVLAGLETESDFRALTTPWLGSLADDSALRR
jgi:predicted unusual protein kinase regulating ubiquinone biosynthesis (AarF/ABC1/UbiB family)